MITRLFKYGLVKVLGAFIFLSLLYFMVDILKVGKYTAQLILIIIVFFSKFILHSFITWGDRRAKTKKEILRRIILYALLGTLLSILNYFIYYHLVKSGIYYLIASIIAGAIITMGGFYLGDTYIFRKK